MTDVRFIAEVSSNHKQDIDRSIAFIDQASSIGCWAVKFQLFKIDKLFSQEILERSQQHRGRRDWELPSSYIPILAQRCKERGIQFACTPFYLEAVSELEPHVDFYKIASYELLWDDLLAACANTGKPVILSTGMATIQEVNHAVKVLKSSGCASPTLLHCNSAYPTPPHDSNLAAIGTIKAATACEVGWSDHTAEAAVLHRAIHRWGVKTIEFHLDLDGCGDEYPSGHCWLPDQIERIILETKLALASDGYGEKSPSPSEIADRDWRADPSDGLRPMQHIRSSWWP